MSAVKKFCMLLVAVAVVSAVLLSGATAQAASYAINFKGRYQDADQLVTGTLGPGPANQANWNNVSSGVDVNSGPGNFNFTALDDSTLNGVNFNFLSNNQGGEDGGGASATDFDRLFSSGERCNDCVNTITSTSLIPFATYDVYVYGGAANVNGGTSPTAFADVDGFTSGGNTFLYSGLSGPLSIGIQTIKGFSIVGPAGGGGAVPEPSTLVLLGLGGLSMLGLTRRRRVR